MSFLSSISSFVSDQKDRFTNVYETEKAVLGNIVNTVSFGTVGTQTKINSSNAVFGAIANNPLTTASLITPVLPTTGSAAVRAGIGSAISAASTTTKVVLGVGAVAGSGIIAANPSQAAVTVLNAPSNLSDFARQGTTVITNPSLSGVKNLAESHPFLTGATVVGGAIAAGGVTSTIATVLNTHAVKENTTATAQGNQTNANDVKIAETNAKAAEKVAEINAKAEKSPPLNNPVAAAPLQHPPSQSAAAPVHTTKKKKKAKKKSKKHKNSKRKRKVNKKKSKKKR